MGEPSPHLQHRQLAHQVTRGLLVNTAYRIPHTADHELLWNFVGKRKECAAMTAAFERLGHKLYTCGKICCMLFAAIKAVRRSRSCVAIDYIRHLI